MTSMDIQKMTAGLVEKIKNDPALLTQFRENPAAVVEKLIGVNLPEAQLRQAAELIKTKIDLDKASGLLGSLFGK